jgi:adenine nucleotide transporter 17
MPTGSTRAQVETRKQRVSTAEAVKRIIEREGIVGLYQGLSSRSVAIISCPLGGQSPPCARPPRHRRHQRAAAPIGRRTTTELAQGVFYGCMEQARTLVLAAKATSGRANTGQMTTLESMLASFLAGVATSTISNPIWVRQLPHR